MKPHDDRATRSFGSFMCLRNLPRLLLDDTAEIIERGTPRPMGLENHAAGQDGALVGKPAKHFGNIPKRIWLKLTGQTVAP